MIQGKPVNLDILRRTTRNDFYQQLGVSEQEAIYPAVCMEQPSDSDQEVYAFFGAVPKPVRTDTALASGPNYAEATALKDYSLSLKNATWEHDVPIKRDIIEDAKLNQVSLRAKSAAESGVAFFDERFTIVLEANGNGYDGVAFFASTHHGGSGNAKTNDMTQSGTANTAIPTVTEFENAFAALLARFRVITDDQGRPANHGNLGIVCVVPPGHERAARAVLEVGPVAGQTGNTGVYKGYGTVKVDPYLTATDKFYAFVTSKVIRPVVYQLRVPWDFNLRTDGDDWFLRNTGHILARGRWDFLLGDWKKAIRFQFT